MDGQLSLFPVEFSKCMNPPETEQEYLKRKLQQMGELADEQIQSNTESRGEHVYHNNKRWK